MKECKEELSPTEQVVGGVLEEIKKLVDSGSNGTILVFFPKGVEQRFDEQIIPITHPGIRALKNEWKKLPQVVVRVEEYASQFGVQPWTISKPLRASLAIGEIQFKTLYSNKFLLGLLKHEEYQDESQIEKVGYGMATAGGRKGYRGRVNWHEGFIETSWGKEEMAAIVVKT